MLLIKKEKGKDIEVSPIKCHMSALENSRTLHPFPKDLENSFNITLQKNFTMNSLWETMF